MHPRSTDPNPDFRTLFESAPGLYLVLTPDLVVVAVSDAYLEATMTRRADILGRGVFEVFPDNPDDPAATGVANLRASLERVLAERRPDAMAVQKYDIRRPAEEGGGFEERHWSPVNSPVPGPDGTLAYIIHRVEDVTEFVRLRAKEHEDSRLAEELRTHAGRMEAEIYRRAQELQQANRELRELHSSLDLRVRERTAELEAVNERMRAEGEQRLRAAEALRASEERYRLLFLANPHPMWVYDRATLGFLAVNDAAIRLYGYSSEEFSRMSIRDIRPPGDVPVLLESLAHERPDLNAPREWRHVTRAGTPLDVEVSSHTLVFGGRDAVLVHAHDVTDRKQLEAQLRQSQKMEAVGRLAGGVAHDFNNLLTVVMGYGDLIQRRMAPDDPARRDAGEIVAVAERAAALTRQLLAFSRQQVLEPRVLDLNAIVTNLDKMLRRLIGEDIDFVTAPATPLGRVKADPGQLEQVLVNLVVNARDAMPDGGRLTIETADVQLGGLRAAGRPDVRPGPYVMLAVSDDGIGMTPEVRSQVFEPFFTTKERGRGTGLGLSTVHGIVQQSDGHIEVYSEPGRGSTFKIYLPRVEDAAAPEKARKPFAGGSAGTEAILLVEDEEEIRRVIRRALESEGYRVLEANDGSTAIALCEDRALAIDLLLTDVVMPLMSGPELVRRVIPIRPDLRVLYVSGYTDRALVHQGLRGDGTAFLQKPFTPETLAIKVREILDQPRRKPA